MFIMLCFLINAYMAWNAYQHGSKGRAMISLALAVYCLTLMR